MVNKMTDPYIMMCFLRIVLRGHKKMGYKVKEIILNTQDNIEIIVSFPNGEERKAVLKLVAE